MRNFLILSVVAALLGASSLVSSAQDGDGKKGPKPKDKKEKRGEDEGKREDEGKEHKKKECGVDRDDYKKQLKKSGKSDDDCERESAEHFSKNHPDGRCHCNCGHGDVGKKHKGDDDDSVGKKKECGVDRDEFKKSLKKKGKGDDDCEQETAEHFKKVHPDGGRCHCTCDHDSSGKPKGNNGVGNGVDPQPPGNPKPNDGPGTGPGNPGNKGGSKGKDKGGKS